MHLVEFWLYFWHRFQLCIAILCYLSKDETPSNFGEEKSLLQVFDTNLTRKQIGVRLGIYAIIGIIITLFNINFINRLVCVINAYVLALNISIISKDESCKEYMKRLKYLPLVVIHLVIAFIN